MVKQMKTSPHFNFFRLVRRNLGSRPLRNIPTLLVFAILAATLFSSQYLMSGARQGLDDGVSSLGADLLVVPQEYSAAGTSVLLTGSPSTFFFNDSGFTILE